MWKWLVLREEWRQILTLPDRVQLPQSHVVHVVHRQLDGEVGRVFLRVHARH